MLPDPLYKGDSIETALTVGLRPATVVDAYSKSYYDNGVCELIDVIFDHRQDFVSTNFAIVARRIEQ